MKLSTSSKVLFILLAVYLIALTAFTSWFVSRPLPSTDLPSYIISKTETSIAFQEDQTPSYLIEKANSQEETVGQNYGQFADTVNEDSPDNAILAGRRYLANGEPRSALRQFAIANSPDDIANLLINLMNEATVENILAPNSFIQVVEGYGSEYGQTWKNAYIFLHIGMTSEKTLAMHMALIRFFSILDEWCRAHEYENSEMHRLNADLRAIESTLYVRAPAANNPILPHHRIMP